MQLQFHKTQLTCLQQVKREVQNQEQTQEVRISDDMPDIGNVLSAWGQLLLRGKEWRSGSMQVSCGVMVWILYVPEEGGQPQCVQTWIPFQLKWELPDAQSDGKIHAHCLLRSVDARSTSARKLMVRVSVSALGEAFVAGQTELYSPQGLPEDIRVHTKSYPVQLPREAGERPFELEETLHLPDTCPRPEELLRCSLQPQITDRKIMTDKVVFRGNVLAHILYRSDTGALCTWDQEIPFSQYAELDETYDHDATVQLLPAVTSLETEIDPEGQVRLKAGLTGQYVISDRSVVDMVEDAYSPGRTVETQKQLLRLPAALEETAQTVRAEQTVPLDGSKVVDVSFCPEHARVQREETGVQLLLPGQYQLLYYDDQGTLQSTTARWEGGWALSAAPDIQLEATVQPMGQPVALLRAGEGELRAELQVDTRSTAGQGIPMVTGLEVGELTEPDPNRPSIILRRAGEDSLWELAKACGSTVEAIREANGLTDEPAAERMLLIPVL